LPKFSEVRARLLGVASYGPVSINPQRKAGERRNKVQYLVTQELVDPGPLLPLDQLLGMYRMAVLPGHEALIKLKSEGKVIAGGYPVGERAIAFIVEADSPKELDSLLLEIPFWGIVKTKVTPLQDFEDRRDQDRQAAEQLEQSLQQ
jgi:muconolactone delta-isomerase